jgi:glucosamine 6-phosphate synthetase-like amidotransferase/phosphosugar isomerase protein
MLKEIFEQPEVLQRPSPAVFARGSRLFLHKIPPALFEKATQSILLPAAPQCTRALGKTLIEQFARIPPRWICLEFRYRNPILDPEGLFIVVSVG